MGQVKFTKNGENNSAQIGEIKSIRFGENNIDIIIELKCIFEMRKYILVVCKEG